MKILCLAFFFIAAGKASDEGELSGKKDRKWQSHQVIADKKYDYNSSTMTPLRFKTVTDTALPETRLTFYYGERLGQLRFNDQTRGVELYACTDDDLYDNNNTLTDVPDGPKRIWEVYWDEKRFYIDCNKKRVWRFEFKDAIFPERDCRYVYTGKHGSLAQFKFNGDRHGINVPERYYTKSK